MAVPSGQAEVAAFLEGLAGAPPVETHISAVFRGADTVWKLKKAVRLPFLDFSGIGDRRRFLQRELELNAPYAPGLYRDVAPIVRQQGGFGFGAGPDGAPGSTVDWVLRMARVSIGIERGPPIGVQKGPPWWVWIGAACRPGAVGVGATGSADVLA